MITLDQLPGSGSCVSQAKAVAMLMRSKPLAIAMTCVPGLDLTMSSR
jgi:hypothetical protein